MADITIGALPFSAATRVGDLLFVSGQVPIDMRAGATVGATLEEQMRQVLMNLQAVLDAAGSSMAAVVKTTAYLTDIGSLEAFNSEYSTYFTAPYPARTLVEVSALAKPEWLVEIDAVARVTTTT
ncbi:MAG: RidA family protein [Pseudoclavibacter sp.]